MKHANWGPLFSANIIGVLNDNFLKNLIAFTGILWVAAEHKSMVIGLASALMVLPFILFSPWAGKLAKEHSKAKIIQYAKLAELPIMAFGAMGFYTENIYIVMTANFIMGFQACMFSPAKYGIIRDIGGKERISYGTGGMEMFTFLGVLFGTALAGIISDLNLSPEFSPYMKHLIFGILTSLAVIGWLVSRFINPKEEQPDEEEHISLNPILFTIHSFKYARTIKGLNYTIFGLGAFWMVASLLQMNIIVFGPAKYQLTNTQTSLIMASLAIAIGLGSFITGILSNHKVKTSLTPIGGTIMGIALLSTVIFNLTLPLFITTIVTAAFFAGMYKVPLNAFLQDQVQGPKLGLILGYNNVSDFMFIIFSAIIFTVIEPIFGAKAIFLYAGIVIIIASIVVFNLIPNSKFKNLR